MNKLIRKLLLIPVVIALFIAAPVMAVELENPINTDDIPTLAGTVIKAVLGFVGSVALLAFIYGGFLWLTSGGNPEKIKKGKDVLIWAAIGLAFIFGSYVVASFVIRTLTGTA
jgi:hypothetical protein